MLVKKTQMYWGKISMDITCTFCHGTGLLTEFPRHTSKTAGCDTAAEQGKEVLRKGAIFLRN
jgi:cytochrome c5